MKILIHEKDANFRSWNLFTSDNETLNKIYKDVHEAINSNKMQSIWQLSKIITKHNLSKKLRV